MFRNGPFRTGGTHMQNRPVPAEFGQLQGLQGLMWLEWVVREEQLEGEQRTESFDL